jgi:hypothetical protein
VPIVATAIVVDAIAVANGEAVPGAIPPDRVLHEPGKRRREGRIELPSIDVRREQAENAGAPSRPVALVSVRMVGAQPLQDPGSVQEIMDQGVDRTKVAPTSTHSGRRLPAPSSSDDRPTNYPVKFEPLKAGFESLRHRFDITRIRRIGPRSGFKRLRVPHFINQAIAQSARRPPSKHPRQFGKAARTSVGSLWRPHSK